MLQMRRVDSYALKSNANMSVFNLFLVMSSVMSGVPGLLFTSSFTVNCSSSSSICSCTAI